VSTVDGARLHTAMGVENWVAPVPFGPDGWAMHTREVNDEGSTGLVLTTACPYDDDGNALREDDPGAHPGTLWIHASITRARVMPSYSDLSRLHRACFPGYAYQLFVPAAEHVNLSRYTLHLWGRADGAPITPRFHGGGPA
jgi:hypothetical protein